MLRNEGDRLLRVIVCSPKEEYFNVTNLKVHNIVEVSDKKKAKQQHNQLRSIMERFKCKVIDIPELHNHPNSVFPRDVALCTPKGYIKLRMGLEARRGEEEWISQILEPMGEPYAGEIKEPGTVEGGDILLAGPVAFIGFSQRTNSSGVKQISGILSKMNYEIRIVTIKSPHFHLGGIMSVIGPELILYCRDMFPKDLFNGFNTIETPCEGLSSGNVICLGENEIIANGTENLTTINILKKKGLKVHSIDLSEFKKGGGGPTCLILPVERK